MVKEGEDDDFDMEAYLKWRQGEGADGAAQDEDPKQAAGGKDDYDDEEDA